MQGYAIFSSKGRRSFWFLDKDLNYLANTFKHAYAHELSSFLLIEQMSKLNENLRWVMAFVMIN